MNTKAKRSLAAGAACALSVGLLVSTPTVANAAPITVDPTTTAVVNLLHFNDFHGRIDANTTVQFAGTIEQLRADYPASTVLLSGGDNIGASAFTSASQGDEPTIEVLNAMGVDAAAVGNHEFDKGVDDLTGRVADLIEFPYLSANVTLDGAPIGPAYELVEIDGITVGVVGAVTEFTPSLVDGSGIVGVEFGDPVAAVNAVAAALTDGNDANGEADVIVAEIHEGSQVVLPVNASQADQQALLAPDAAAGGPFGDIVNGLSADIDVIFNGHTHRTYSWLAPVPGAAGETRPVVQSNEYSNLVGQVVLAVDRASLDVSVEVLTNHARTTAAPADLVAAYPRVAAVKQIVDAAVAQAAVIGNVEVGTVSGPITVPALSNGNRGEESTAAQMVANMYRDQLAPDNRGGADIGIVNPGGVRDSLLYAATAPETEDGVVRLAEANNVLPFINNLWTITMTGAELDLLLEQQWQRDAAGVPLTTGRTYLQLGLSDNVTYVSDPSRPIDDRVSDIAIDGEFISADQEIRIASASFLMGVNGGTPGDNFWAFAEGTDERDSGLVDLDALLAYLADNPGLAPDYSVRHVDIVGLPEGAIAAGSEHTVEVRQLDRIRSLGAQASETVEIVDAAGQVVGTGDVVVNTDASGAPLTTSASVTFTVSTPERTELAPSTETYVVRTDTGSEIPFQLEVLPSTRVDGGDRYETAVNLSASAYPEGAPVVYVASGQVWSDALAAGPAAAHEGGPLLLVQKDAAPEVVLEEIERLGAERVVIVGGEQTISAATQAAIGALAGVGTVDRVAGIDRYTTSLAVAEYAFDTADGAYVATGLGFSDALSAGAAAGHLDWPLLLIDPRAAVNDETKGTLAALSADRVRVAGGPATIPSSVVADFVDAGHVVSRLGGADRYAVSAAITRSAFSAADHAYLASGLVFSDALAGAAVAGAQDEPLMIVRATCVPQNVHDELERLGVTGVTLVGGPATLTEEVEALVTCG
ncbi:cell wall-binding repeat-containing protein [Agrococcus sp. TF02-05]|uniref:cell wall-binding repeat-containing protein n=1 Tax=Agrococcus sp. TF02-05 TaxID=2815211 RepID=UPI001AA0F6EF|nr:cell wall-binding repeat-containing protein [Agrococcus sp. TF02-05]MBO1770965.1 cell wall-binding repeat-containing protein [Agrococcus sp. TF02-05]